MRVQVHAADEGGCGHYRMIWPAAAAAAQGHDVTLVLNGTIDMETVRDEHGKRQVMSVAPIDADVLVLQRTLNRVVVDAIPLIQAQGTAVVVELDDDFQNLHRLNTAWVQTQPSLSPDANWQHLKRASVLADAFVCTSPALARLFGARGRKHVIPNYLPDLFRHVTPKTQFDPDDVRVGWSGSVGTHPTDLQEIASFVQRFDDRTHMDVLGTGEGVERCLGTDRFTPSEWVRLHEYPQQMARFDVGVVPLAPIAFNQAKSWLKGLELAGAGVPFIASPTDEYRRLQREHGLGRVVKKPRDWERQLNVLRDPAVRQEEAQAQRDYVLANMMIDQHVPDWLSAWTAAFLRRRVELGVPLVPLNGSVAAGERFKGTDILAQLGERSERIPSDV